MDITDIKKYKQAWRLGMDKITAKLISDPFYEYKAPALDKDKPDEQTTKTKHI